MMDCSSVDEYNRKANTVSERSEETVGIGGQSAVGCSADSIIDHR